MSAFIMVVFILEVKTEWISYSSSDWKIVERQQGVTALLLYRLMPNREQETDKGIRNIFPGGGSMSRRKASRRVRVPGVLVVFDV